LKKFGTCILARITQAATDKAAGVFFENWSVGKDITFNKGRTDMSLSRLL